MRRPSDNKTYYSINPPYFKDGFMLHAMSIDHEKLGHTKVKYNVAFRLLNYEINNMMKTSVLTTISEKEFREIIGSPDSEPKATRNNFIDIPEDVFLDK